MFSPPLYILESNSQTRPSVVNRVLVVGSGCQQGKHFLSRQTGNTGVNPGRPRRCDQAFLIRRLFLAIAALDLMSRLR